MNRERKLMVLEKIAGILNQERICWAVGGSLLLYFKGITDEFHDIDLMVAEKDIARTGELLGMLGKKQERHPDSRFRTRHFLEYVIEGTEVDVMAGFVIVKDGAEYDGSLYPEQITDRYRLKHTDIPLQSVHLWKQYYALMERPEKCLMIDRRSGPGGSSAVQKMIEGFLYRTFVEETGDSSLRRNAKLILDEDGTVFIRPDFYSEKTGVIGEIHAHPGRLKPSQMHKAAADVLKMLAAEKAAGRTLCKYFVVCSEAEKEQLLGQSYLSFIIRSAGIEVVCYALPGILRMALEDAVCRQDMLRNERYAAAGNRRK